MQVDGVSLTVGGTAVAALASVATAWIKARFGRTKVEPQPLVVRPAEEYAKKEELDELRREMRADIADVRRLNERVSDKVDHIVIPVLYQIAGKVGATPVATGGQ